MTLRALVFEGEVVGYTDVPPQAGDLVTQHPSKPHLVPVVVDMPDFDPVSQVRGEREVVVEADRVVWTSPIRAKDSDEIAAMRAAKRAEVNAEFDRLWQLPIQHAVAAGTYVWDADQTAVGNISGLLDVYREAATLSMQLPDQRYWTTHNDERVLVSRDEIAALGIAIAVRKDALFGLKKAKHAAIAALTDPTAIAAYDVASGWE